MRAVAAYEVTPFDVEDEPRGRRVHVALSFEPISLTVGEFETKDNPVGSNASGHWSCTHSPLMPRVETDPV